MLLDTHIALWAILGDRRLPRIAKGLIEDLGNDVIVSVASIWEITIKHGLARGSPNDMPVSGQEALGYFRLAGYGLLPIKPEHAAGVACLPPIHADPFDRILVAQAQLEPLRLVTHDARLVSYGSIVLVV